MQSKIANIILVISLILSVLGVTSFNAFCSTKPEQKAHPCCTSKDFKGDYCKAAYQSDSNANKVFVDASVDVPVFLLFSNSIFLNTEIFCALLKNKHSNNLYKSPLHTSDLSVLHRVFRL